MPLFETIHSSVDKFLYFFGEDEDWERLIIGNCRTNEEVYLFSSREYLNSFPSNLKRVKSRETLKRVLYHISLNKAVVFIDLCAKNVNTSEISVSKTVCKVVFRFPIPAFYFKYNGLEINSKRSKKYLLKYK